MTLETYTPSQYDGDGSTITFSVKFEFWDDDDVQAILTDSSGSETIWTRGTQFTLTGGSGDTGTLTVKTSPIDYTPATGETLTLKSVLARTQPSKLPAGGSLPSGVIEQQLDQIVRQGQQDAEELDRAIKFKVSSAKKDISIAEPEAGKIIRWNSAENALENVDAQGSGSLTVPVSIADGGTGGTTAAAAQTNLGIKLTAQRVTLWQLGQF